MNNAYLICPCCLFLDFESLKSNGSKAVNPPDLAAFEHARVHDVRTHQGGLHAVQLLGQQFVGQRLVEAHRGELTGAVVLKAKRPFTLVSCPQFGCSVTWGGGVGGAAPPRTPC